MQIAPREPRVGPILLQWAIVAVFFLPGWWLYEYRVSPGLRPETRVIWDVAVPAVGFALAVALTFAYRAWRMARKRAIADGR